MVVNGVTINYIRYVDAIGILVISLQDLQKLLVIITEAMCFRLNVKKTKLMIINVTRDYIRGGFNVDGNNR